LSAAESTAVVSSGVRETSFDVRMKMIFSDASSTGAAAS
jgi:hypothetical protein